MQAFLAFLQYLVAALLLLAAFLAVYVRVTPYNEFELIGQNNAAAAIIARPSRARPADPDARIIFPPCQAPQL